MDPSMLREGARAGKAGVSSAVAASLREVPIKKQGIREINRLTDRSRRQRKYGRGVLNM